MKTELFLPISKMPELTINPKFSIYQWICYNHALSLCVFYDLFEVRSLTFQFVAGGIVLASVCVTIGNMFGFSAILLPQLEDENIRTANSDEASWIGN